MNLARTICTALLLAVASSTYAIDTDRDGLTDSYETSIGTNPSLYDTDGDGYNDGIEDANVRVGALDGDPLDFSRPQWAQQSYDLRDIVRLVPEDSLHHRITPTLSPDGRKIAYVKTDLNLQNMEICIIDNLSAPSERVLAQLTASDQSLFFSISFNLEGTRIYFADRAQGIDTTTNLYFCDVDTGAITQVTNLSENQHIADPYFVHYPQSSSVFPKEWLFVATAGVRGSGVTEITAYPFNGLAIDFNNPVSVADLADSQIEGIERWPKLDADGRRILFGVPRTAPTNGTYITIIADGVDEILTGQRGKFINVVDADVDFAGFSGQTSIPIGITPSGSSFVVAQDMSATFHNISNPNFALADFDLVLGSFGYNTSQSLVVASRGVVPFEGNQFTGFLSRDGTQIVYASDSNFEQATNFNLHTGSICTINRLVWNEETTTGPVSLEDFAGIRLEIPDGASYDFSSIMSPVNGTLTVKSLPLSDVSSAEGIAAVRVFGPSGTTFGPSWIDGESVRLLYRYEDSAVDSIGVPEEELRVFKFNETTQLWDIELPISNRDTTNNTLEVTIPGFSKFGIGGLTDSDHDLIPDIYETGTGIYIGPSDTGTDPDNADTDGDGIIDGIEVDLGTDPNEPLDFPSLKLAWSLSLILLLAIVVAGVFGVKRRRLA